MSKFAVDVVENGYAKSGDSPINSHELDEYDFSQLPDRPRSLNLDR